MKRRNLTRSDSFLLGLLSVINVNNCAFYIFLLLLMIGDTILIDLFLSLAGAIWTYSGKSDSNFTTNCRTRHI